MGWSEEEVVCRRHPNETPQPGICPSCLRDRLSIISGNNSRFINNTSCSSSSPSFSASPVYYYYYSSASSSRGFSPAKGRRRHQRVASDILDSIYLAISGTSALKKSRSMVNYAPRNINNGERDHHHHHQVQNRKKNKGGFWNKLLLLRFSGKKAKF